MLVGTTLVLKKTDILRIDSRCARVNLSSTKGVWIGCKRISMTILQLTISISGKFAYAKLLQNFTIASPKMSLFSLNVEVITDFPQEWIGISVNWGKIGPVERWHNQLYFNPQFFDNCVSCSATAFIRSDRFTWPLQWARTTYYRVHEPVKSS